MGGRGQSSASAYALSEYKQWMNEEFESVKNSIEYQRTKWVKEDLDKQMALAKKIAGTELGAKFHEDNKTGNQLSALGIRLGSNYRLTSDNLKDWANGRQRPLEASKERWDKAKKSLKELSKDYDYLTIATAFNFSHVFPGYWEIGKKS